PLSESIPLEQGLRHHLHTSIGCKLAGQRGIPLEQGIIYKYKNRKNGFGVPKPFFRLIKAG
ncbi:MAG: hypothetical protein IJF00_06515, partial [Bacteroidaceae bacterium]|nr:hypothetical protein [Bacteroidaceae bacterium]